MDIRQFFGKASQKKKKNESSASSSNPATERSSNDAGTTSNKKEITLLDDDSTEDEDVVIRRPAPKSAKKKTKPRNIILEDDSSTDDEAGEPVQKKTKSSPAKPTPKKEEQRTEISAEDFFAQAEAKMSDKKKEEPVQTTESADRLLSTPEKPQSKKRDRSREEPEQSEAQGVETTVSPVTPPSEASASPKKRTKLSSTKKKTPSSTKKKAPAKKKEKEPLLQPTLSLKSFRTDEAASECLSGLTFVFTGILPEMSRDAAQDYVKILGGRVTTAISGRTDYLVVGEILENGLNYTEGSKYKKALELNTIVVKGVEQLYGLAMQYSDKKGGTKVLEDEVSPATAEKQRDEKSQNILNPYAKRSAATITNPYAKKAKPNESGASNNPYAKRSSSATPEAAPPPAAGDPLALWSDKYAPQQTRDILGNQDSVRKLTAWLEKWERIFNSSRAQGKSFSAPGGPRKAALLSGPPGIGKTTTAILVTKEAGRKEIEFNASDVRSKKGIAAQVAEGSCSHVVNAPVQSGGKRPPVKKRCIIMDEVDGMGAGDRSGMAELIKMIKSSRVPIICICNDRQSQKVRSLVPYCLDLRFKRPVKSVIARRAVRIGEMEGMKIEVNAAEAIAESCGNDIRQVLNTLQMWASKKGPNASMTYKNLKERQGFINKDAILRVNLFDATKTIVEGRRGLTGGDPKTERESLFKRTDAFFVDYGLMGLMVQQNYLKAMTGKYSDAKRSGDEEKMLQFLDSMHSASHSVSDFAVAEHAVRSGDQNWSLLPFCSILAVKTGYHAGGETGGFLPSYPEFSAWMGKNSTRGKKNRLLNELKHHMNYKVSGGSQELRLCYIPTLRDRFLSLLTSKEGVRTTEAIELMDEYGLDRDDIFENLDEFKMDPKAKTFASLDSKQKAAFTREYNSGSHTSQALVAEQGAGKTRKRKAEGKDPDLVDPDAADEEGILESSSDADDDEEDTEKIIALFHKKGKRAAKSKKGSGGARKKAAMSKKGSRGA